MLHCRLLRTRVPATAAVAALAVAAAPVVARRVDRLGGDAHVRGDVLRGQVDGRVEARVLARHLPPPQMEAEEVMEEVLVE